MARLKTLGFELQSTTGGHEYDANVGPTTPTIDTTTFRSGAAALKINTTAGNASYITYQYRGTSSSKVFARIYINISSAPASNGTIFGLINAGDTDQGGGLKLNTDRTVSLIGGSGTSFGTVGSASAALALNTWYRLEITFDDSDANNVIAAFLDGVQFASGNGQDMAGASVTFALGDIDSVGMTVFFDDLAINDSTGSFQTGLPGAGKVLYLKPDSAGDANTFGTQTGGTAGAANNFSRVNETTPDDATTFNGSSTLNQEDLLNFGASGIGANDTVNVVEVHGRFRNSTADATAKITFEVEKTGSGTKTSSSAITPNSTTWRTNVAGTTVPKTAPIITYQNPDAAAWTQTTVDSLQAGYKLTTGPGTAGRRIDVTKVWVIVDYTPITTTTQTLLGKARITASTLQTLLAKARVTATTLQTILAKARVTASTTQTVFGKGRITATTTQTTTGKARIQATALQTLQGLARIGLVTARTLQGLSRIQKAVLQTITGLARITSTTTQTILGKADITATTTQTIPGKSRITRTATQTVSGLARVTIATTQDIPAKSRITATTTRTIPATARVTATTTQTLPALARISVVVLRTILGKANMLSVATIVAQTILGKSRVTARTTRTIKGKALILSTVSKPTPSIIFLTDGRLATHLAGNVYLPL